MQLANHRASDVVSFKRSPFLLALILVAVLSPIGAFAEDLLAGEIHIGKPLSLHRQWISGVGEGIYTLNSRLQKLGKPAFYCPPEEFRLSTENYVAILEQELNRKKRTEKFWALLSVADVLLDGLIRKFPCKN